MPDSSHILAQLSSITNAAWPLAVAWHALALGAGVALALGWRPSVRAAHVLAGLPTFTVSLLAFAWGNPFNGGVFAVLSFVIVALALRLPTAPFRAGSTWSVAAGATLVAYGLVYPHFLDAPAWMFVFAAPVGLVPCPTLAVLSGIALISDRRVGRAWCATVALAGVAYGLLGLVRLGVSIDIVLLAGATLLLARTAAPVPVSRFVAHA